MAALTAAVINEVDELVSVSIKTDLSRLVDKGLNPQQVCDKYFKACKEKDADTWLATLHHDRCAEATSEYPGPFDTCDWDLGRARVEKYKVNYKFKNSSKPVSDGADQMITLTYEPSYGVVPGYEPGAALGPEIRLILKKQGEKGEWKIYKGCF